MSDVEPDMSRQHAEHVAISAITAWAAARADLSDPENLKQYEDVYQRLADYYSKQ